jgi:hypothetical protein
VTSITTLVEVEVTLRLTVSQAVCLGIEYPRGTCDQILFPVGKLLSEICGLVSGGRPLWWEDGSAICSINTQRSELLGTHNHILLSHLRLPQSWSRSRSYFMTDNQSVCLGIKHPCGTCDQILFPVGMLLSEICGLVSVGCPLWGEDGCATCKPGGPGRSWSYFTTVSQSVCLGIEYPFGTCDQILFPVGMLLSEICGLVFGGRPLWWEDGSAICSVITQWSELLRTRNHILLSHLRLPQPWSQSRSYFTTDSQYVLVLSTLVGLATRYCFLSECCCLKFAVLYLLGTLSDERKGLPFAV